MTPIILKINPAESDFNSLYISINNQPVEYLLTNHTIEIAIDLDMGIHQLSVRLHDGSRLTIDDVIINHSGVRQTLYLSYIKTSTGQFLQPATVLWDKTQEWILPFGNPVSFWLTLVNSKVPAGELGSDLFEKYNIQYPCKIKLQIPCLPLVKDFFEHNFDFFFKPKEDLHLLSQRKINLDMSLYDVQSVVNEIEKNWQYISTNQRIPAQEQYNSKELPTGSARWMHIQLIQDGNWTTHIHTLPLLQDLIQKLPVSNIKKSFLNILPPGAIIAPHIDNVMSNANQLGQFGCNTLYIPLSWPSGNYFKFATGGLIDSDSPWMINTGDHTHALINQSDQNRLVLTLMPFIEKDQDFFHLLA